MLSLREAGVSLIDCDHRTPPASAEGYPYVTIPQLCNGRIDLTDVRKITREHFVEWTRKSKPKTDDVILSRRCNPGETAFVSPNLEFALGQNLVLLRSDGTKVYPPFLRWLTRGPDWWEQIGKFLNVGAVFDSLKCADILKFKLHIPPLEEQRAIAHILGTLDDKIELNRKTNKTLEDMARAIFKSWFVDFDPVRAKMEGRWRRGQSLPGLPAHLFDLFPDRLVDSPLGPIPEGWEIKRLSDVGKIICGKTPPTNITEYYGDEVPFVTIPDMHGNVFAITTQRKLSNIGASSQANKTLPSGTICVSCIATPGLVVITTEESQTNQQINSVVLDESNQTYYWFWIFRDLGDEIRANGSGGSVLTNLSTGRFSEFRVLAPTNKLRCLYDSCVASLFDKILLNLHESINLSTIRDLLLPKLISGQIRAKNAELFLKERGGS